MLWEVTGADRLTGEERTLSIEADNEDSAIRRGNRRGLLVSTARPLSAEDSRVGTATLDKPTAEAKPLMPRAAAAVPPALPTAQPTHHALNSRTGGSRKLPVIIFASLAFVFLIAAGLFVFTHGRTNHSSRPQLSVQDQSFLDAVGKGDMDGVKEGLLANLDWQAVSTPALEDVLSVQRLRSFDFETDDAKAERQFWTDFAGRMVQNGADINRLFADNVGLSGFQFLIAHGANVNAVGSLGQTALINIADDDGSEDSVGFLISKGANVTAADPEGNTALHAAAKGNAVKVIARLLDANASVNAKNNAGKTPLAIANLTMQRDAADLIKSHGGTE